MNFKQIEAFRSIMHSGSMTAAAREMHTSQPNISRLIGQLEDQAGFALFERVSGRLIPTPEAEALFKDVERAFVGLETIKSSVKYLKEQGTGHLRVGAVPSMALTIVPNVIHKLSKRFTNVRVSLHISDTLTISQWTASRFCDIGVSSYTTDTAGVQATLIDVFNGVCILPPNHWLASKEAAITPSDLADEVFFSLPSGDGTRKIIDQLFSSEIGKPRIMYECPYAAAICMMVGKGMGVSIVNPLVAKHFVHTGIVIRELAPAPIFSCYGLRSTQYPSSVLAKHFDELLKEEITLQK